MPTALHILTTRDDALAQRIILLQKERAEVSVQVAELFETAQDYSGLLEKVFEADSVAIW